MENLTFENLPTAVSKIFDKVSNIERLLQTPPAPVALEEDRWFSIDELCNYLPGNPAKATIYSKVHNRTLPHKKFGKRLLFLKSEIDFYLKSQGRKTGLEIDAEAEAFIQSKNKKG